MYADDAVMLTHARNSQEASHILTSAMANVQDWLTQSCLLLNTKKTVCMFFTKRKPTIEIKQSNVFLNNVELSLVREFKYLGVTLDSTLTFESHINKISNSVRYNLHNFRHIRYNLPEKAARSYLHSMLFSRIEYCLSTWSYTSGTALKPIESLYNRSLKVFDKKKRSYHHCNILSKYALLSFDNLVFYKSACLIFKALNGLAPPPLTDLFHKKTERPNQRTTRATARGDCEKPHKPFTFSQNGLSFKCVDMWNTLPVTIRECPTYGSFKSQLRVWLITNQACTHV